MGVPDHDVRGSLIMTGVPDHDVRVPYHDGNP